MKAREAAKGFAATHLPMLTERQYTRVVIALTAVIEDAQRANELAEEMIRLRRQYMAAMDFIRSNKINAEGFLKAAGWSLEEV